MSTRLTHSLSRVRRGIALTAGLLSIGGLVVVASSADSAGAAPQPTVQQVQVKINRLTTQFNKVSEQYDQASQQLSAAKSKLSQVRTHLKHARARFQSAQDNVARTAAAVFEDTGATSIAGLLTSGDPAAVLQQGSLLMELSGNRTAMTQQLLNDASQLAGVEQQMQRTESGIAGLKSQLASHQASLGKLIDSQKTMLASLTVPQQRRVAAHSIGGNGSDAPQQYDGPTDSQAGKAVAFAYAQLGCPYVYGGTGPCQLGFDCSGLAMSAWAAAGVQIPRDSYGQWAALPHVPLSDIQPGDLLIYNGEGHVAIYVGDGYIIDAPQSGMNVQKIPMSTPWYADSLDGALRP